MFAHVLWSALLYLLLTIVRAPKVWGVFSSGNMRHLCSGIEPRVSANLSNQFEWPILFYVVCLLQLMNAEWNMLQLWLAWIFIMGRIVHSMVQIFTDNVRLRGMVFTINFLAVLVMWVLIAFQ